MIARTYTNLALTFIMFSLLYLCFGRVEAQLRPEVAPSTSGTQAVYVTNWPNCICDTSADPSPK